MPKKVFIVAAVALAAVIGYVIYRRRQGLPLMGVANHAPSPQTALATLHSTPPRELASAAAGYIASQIPSQVGGGSTAVIPHSGAAGAKQPCPPGYVGYNPTDPSEYCAGQVTAGSKTAALIDQIKAKIGTNYNPVVGYYG